MINKASFLFLLLSHVCTAQESDRFTVKSWNVEDGLPQGTVRCITQTDDGYLWAGTWNGLARFDGLRMKVFRAGNTPELLTSNIMSLFTDSKGRLWIGTDGGGLVRYTTHAFTRYDSSLGIDATRILAIDEDTQGRLWLATERGIYVFKDERFLHFTKTDGLPSTYANQIFPLSDGRMYLGFVSYGSLARLNGDTVVVDDAFNVNGLVSVDSMGAVWTVLQDRGVVRRLNRIEKSVTAFGRVQPGSMMTLRSQEQWLILWNEVRVLRGSQLGFLREIDGFTFAGISAWFEDREGIIWLGKEGAGLIRLSPKRVQMISERSGLSSLQVACGMEDREGNVWIGTWNGGLYKGSQADLSQFARIPVSAGRISIPTICESPDGTVWIGTWGDGVYSIRGGIVRKFVHESMESAISITAVVADLNGGIWIATAHDGIRHFDGREVKRWTTASGLSSGRISSLRVARDGVLWAGSAGGGIIRIDRGQVSVLKKEDGLLDNSISVLREDSDGAMWLGTNRGMQRWKNGLLSTITEREGLHDETVGQFIEDANGDYWMGATHGIFRVRRKELNDVADGSGTTLRCFTIGKEDGMVYEETSGGGNVNVWKTRDGSLWFSTNGGVVRIDPRSVASNPVPPGVLIEEAWVEHKPASFSAGLTMRPGQTKVELRYTGINFSSPQKIRFKHMLEGFDEDWKNAGAERLVQYTNLDPGEYTFRVIAANNAGIWNETGASLTITVLPALWQTWWFRGTALVALFVGFGGMVRYFELRKIKERMRKLEQGAALERERVRIARDMHDDLGARLTKISILLGLAQRDVRNADSMEGHLSTLDTATRDVEQTMDEIIWSVDPKYDSLDSLLTYIMQYAEEYLEPTEIRFRFELPQDIPKRMITADERHTIFSIVKESLNNSVKHSEAKEVQIAVSIMDQQVTVSIRDDGKGFDVFAIPDFHHGVRNMKERMNAMDGTCLVESGRGEGTLVRIRFSK